MNFSAASLALGGCVFLSAVLTSIAAYFDLPETHPLALPIFVIVFLVYLPELPLMAVVGNMGYPLVLPGLSVVFAVLGYRRRENYAVLRLAGIAMVALGLLIVTALKHFPRV